MNRRNFINIGTIGGTSLCLADYMYLKAEESINKATAKSVIYIFLPGGYSHQETFDPKINAPVEYRGPLKSISTSIPGIHYGELLAETSKIANKLVTIRSMTHSETAHERGTNNMFTGYKPSPSIQYPSIGSVVSHELTTINNIPSYITIPTVPNEFAGAGYLSHSYSSFSVGSNPEDLNFKVKDLQLPNGISIERFNQRTKMLKVVNERFNTLNKSDKLTSMNSFYENAFDIMSSNKVNDAFDLTKENDKTKEDYGKNAAGMRMLLGRRLIEAGARFITITFGGWDHHDNIESNMKNQLPSFDRAFSRLIKDLDDRGLLSETLVCVATEFGRTPKINPTGGRDHWPRVFSAIMAGGGLKEGVVYGASNETGSDVQDNPYTIEDWAATIYSLVGIDPNKHLIAPGNRPVKIVDGGNVKKEIIQ
jgi:hypothetical protein